MARNGGDGGSGRDLHVRAGEHGGARRRAGADTDTAATDSTVPTGEVDGAIVAVDVPPVPPTSVPPSSVIVAVDEPPVPPTSSWSRSTSRRSRR